MVSDYATKSIVLVDFRGFAIAVPFLREIKNAINAKFFSELEGLHQVDEEAHVHEIAVSWRNSANDEDFSILKVVIQLQRATLAG